MKPTEAAALLTIAAAFDNRKPDPDTAKAWAMALDGYRFEDCRQVIVQHYRESTDWIMPAHVLRAVKRLRKQRLDATPDPIPPADLTPQQTLAWLRDVRRRIADGEHVPDADRGELTERNLPELKALIRNGPQPATPNPQVERLRAQIGADQ